MSVFKNVRENLQHALGNQFTLMSLHLLALSVVKCETITKLKMRRKFTACFWGSIHFDGFCSFCFSFTEMWVNHTYVDMEGSLSFVSIVASFSCAVHHFVGANVLR